MSRLNANANTFVPIEYATFIPITFPPRKYDMFLIPEQDLEILIKEPTPDVIEKPILENEELDELDLSFIKEFQNKILDEQEGKQQQPTKPKVNAVNAGNDWRNKRNQSWNGIEKERKECTREECNKHFSKYKNQ